MLPLFREDSQSTVCAPSVEIELGGAWLSDKMQVSAPRLALVGWLCDASMFYSNVEKSRVIMLSYQY